MDIVERLSNFDINVSLRFDNWSAFHELKQEVAAEIERLRQFEKDWQAMRDERDAARTGYDNLLDENRGLVKLEAENERLRAAMEPFARFFKSDNHDLSVAQDHTIVATFLGADKLPLAELTIADFRRAHAALSGKTEDDRG